MTYTHFVMNLSDLTDEKANLNEYNLEFVSMSKYILIAY
jgi:chemotaxis protein CheY-P-specific phosphatase CheC